jgi:CRP-like cAMP-binding protein
MATRKARTRTPNAGELLATLGVTGTTVEYKPSAVVFAQGDPCAAVMYIQKGRVKLSVASQRGKQAVLGVLQTGDFFGEGSLAGQPQRVATAVAMTPSAIVIVDAAEMVRQLHTETALSDCFLSYLLSRNIRIEAALIDQLFVSSEKRLASALLLLARYGEQNPPRHILPKVSQRRLAEMIGTPRSRVNFLMNKFRKLGFIMDGGHTSGVTIHRSLLRVVLQD